MLIRGGQLFVDGFRRLRLRPLAILTGASTGIDIQVTGRYGASGFEHYVCIDSKQATAGAVQSTLEA